MVAKCDVCGHPAMYETEEGTVLCADCAEYAPSSFNISRIGGRDE